MYDAKYSFYNTLTIHKWKKNGYRHQKCGNRCNKFDSEPNFPLPALKLEQFDAQLLEWLLVGWLELAWWNFQLCACCVKIWLE